MRITVLLADSVKPIRELERRVLEREPDIEVVAEAADESEVMILIRSFEPQIVVN